MTQPLREYHQPGRNSLLCCVDSSLVSHPDELVGRPADGHRSRLVFFAAVADRSEAQPAHPRSADPADYLAALERLYGLPAGILDVVWKLESDRGRDRSVSRSGARGPFQFRSAAAHDYGLRHPEDFSEAAQAAARYLADLRAAFDGDARKALAAYNMGPAALRAHLAWHRRRHHADDWCDCLPAGTGHYVKTAERMMGGS